MIELKKKLKTSEEETSRKPLSKKKIIIVFIVLLILTVFLWYENNHLVVSSYVYESDKISQNLDGFKIVQISDLHNASFGKDNERLLELIKAQNPDIIVLTGDLVDSNHTNIECALEFAGNVVGISQTYYITGNHEYWLDNDDYEALMYGLKSSGVVILDNELVPITVKDETFNLIGLDDNSLIGDTAGKLVADTSKKMNIVLAHEPQYINSYSRTKADLILTGHAHGGQIRLPFIGGLVAPDQGFLPEYTSGEYKVDETTMIVSRGLGNSIIPFRIFNDPEVVCVELRSAD